MIRFEGVSKRYPSPQGEYYALKDINLTVKPGEIFGIIGRSGAGKSTLVRCANLLERPNVGKVMVNGLDLMQLNAEGLRQARQKIGMIFQQFNLLASRTVYDNIALPLELSHQSRGQIATKVNALLALTGLESRKHHYPAQLSGGQKQRVAIARALACDPKILLSDEATSALDPETTQSILGLLKSINQDLGLTILLITHEMPVIKQICDRAGVLDHGSLVEVAPVVELFTRPQSSVAKSFTQSEMHVELPAHIQQQLYPTPSPDYSPLVRLAFIGESTDEPFIVSLFTRFNVIANILQAHMEMVHNASLGIAICQMLGDAERISQSIDYLRLQGIQVEVLGYVPNRITAQ